MKRLLAFLTLLISALAQPAAAATKEVGPIVSNVVTPLTDQALIPLDASTAYAFSLTLGGDHTIDNATGLVAGSLYSFAITQDGTGNRVLSYGNQWRFPSATPPALSTAAGSLDLLVFYSDGTFLNFLTISRAIAAPVSAPTALAVTPDVEQCTLSWTDNSSDETGFELMACQDLGGPCDPTIVGPLTTTAANATGYVDTLTGLSGETFRYAVRAKRGATVSAFSNVVSCLVQ